METAPIKSEVLQFLQTSGVSARQLAREAGIPAASVLHLSCGGRKDVMSMTADKLRAAMARLSQEQAASSGRSQNGQQ